MLNLKKLFTKKKSNTSAPKKQYTMESVAKEIGKLGFVRLEGFLDAIQSLQMDIKLSRDDPSVVAKQKLLNKYLTVKEHYDIVMAEKFDEEQERKHSIQNKYKKRFLLIVGIWGGIMLLAFALIWIICFATGTAVSNAWVASLIFLISGVLILCSIMMTLEWPEELDGPDK